MSKTTLMALFIAIGIIVIVAIALLSGNVGNQTPDLNNFTQQSTQSPQSPNATSSPSSQAGSFTSAQVALHANIQSCWTIIRGDIYDLTPWISQHPGGERAILQLCGTDGTTKFENKHGGQEKPEQALASFKIGILAQ